MELWVTVLILILPWPVVNADAAEKRLVLYLMKHYNRFERPVYEPGTSLNLTMNVDLQVKHGLSTCHESYFSSGRYVYFSKLSIWMRKINSSRQAYGSPTIGMITILNGSR